MIVLLGPFAAQPCTVCLAVMRDRRRRRHDRAHCCWVDVDGYLLFVMK
jgi:hypothetical protein